jgi:chemotaxis protein methyltransferase CheR
MPEFHLDDQQYGRYRALVQHHCGLTYPDHKRADLAQGIVQTCRDNGIATPDQLYAELVGGSALWDSLITHLTIGETYFFRNQPQFAALRSAIVPDLMSRRAMSQHLRVWSAGCATGEEPYSIAIALSELFQQHPGWQASLLATDINPAFLERAQAALYGAWSFRDTPDAVRDRYFQPEQSRWRLTPDIRRMVRFARLNLAEPGYPSVVNGTCAMDLILCRNVTIYFDEASTRAVVDRMYHALTPGGWLIVGHSEPQVSVYRQFEVHNFPDTVIYRKPLNAPLFFAGQPTQPSPEHHVPPANAAPSAPARARVREVRAPAASTDAQADLPPRPHEWELLPLATMLSQAQAAADQGNWHEAAEQCERILQREPLMVRAHYLLGHVLEQHGDLDGAIAAYRRTIYLDRTFVMGTLGMGHIWRKKGRLQDSQRCYRNALAQLEHLPLGVPVAGAESLSVAELVDAVKQLMQALPAQP